MSFFHHDTSFPISKMMKFFIFLFSPQCISLQILLFTVPASKICLEIYHHRQPAENMYTLDVCAMTHTNPDLFGSYIFYWLLPSSYESSYQIPFSFFMFSQKIKMSKILNLDLIAVHRFLCESTIMCNKL